MPRPMHRLPDMPEPRVCPCCTSEVDEAWSYCPYCGEKLPPTGERTDGQVAPNCSGRTDVPWG